MKYLNQKTGAILDSPCQVSGGDWVEYSKQNEKINVSVQAAKAIMEEPAGISKGSKELTREEVINELEALGIEFNKKAKKEELLKLLMGE